MSNENFRGRCLSFIIQFFVVGMLLQIENVQAQFQFVKSTVWFNNGDLLWDGFTRQDWGVKPFTSMLKRSLGITSYASHD